MSSDGEKAGFLKKKEGALRKSWETRWCTLKRQQFNVYKKKEDSRPLFSLTLTEATVVQPSAEEPELGFEIQQDNTVHLFCAESPDEMTSWINSLVQASYAPSTPSRDRPQISANQSKALVFAIKGMLCLEHADRVRSIVADTHGIEKFNVDYENELVHACGTFDELILRNNIERVGFLVYDEPNLDCNV